MICKPEDPPLATTGQVDGSGLPLSANLHRPPLSLPNQTISFYLLAEWSRREKKPPKLPDFPCPAAPVDGPAAKVAPNPIDGSEMISIPGGKFWRGCCDGELDEMPFMAVDVKPLAIAKREVTVGQFEKFVAATGYIPRPRGPASATAGATESGRRLRAPTGATPKVPGNPPGPMSPLPRSATRTPRPTATGLKPACPARTNGKRLLAAWPAVVTLGAINGTKRPAVQEKCANGKRRRASRAKSTPLQTNSAHLRTSRPNRYNPFRNEKARSIWRPAGSQKFTSFPLEAGCGVVA